MPIGDRVTPEMITRYRAEGVWPAVSNIDLLDHIAVAHPDKEALVDSHERLTFAEFALGTRRLALAFHEIGLRKGDVVVAQVSNSCAYMLLQFGFRRLGVISLFVTMDQRAHEVRHALDRTEAVAVFLESNNQHFNYVTFYQDEVLPVSPRVKYVFAVGQAMVSGMISVSDLLTDPIETRYPDGYLDGLRPDLEDYTALTSTSGTTALPKFILQKDLTNLGKWIAERLRLTPNDVALVVAPLRGGGANGYKWGFTHVGMKGVLQGRFDVEEALRLVERERVTLICGVPAQYVKMLACPSFDRYDLSSLRVAFCAGAHLPPHVADEIHRRMGAEVVTDYGAMDAGNFTLATLDDPAEVRHHTVGRPLPGVTIRVVDHEGRDLPPGGPGEIWTGGPNVGRAGGYWRDPELTAQAFTSDGWYMTGDIGVVHPNGTVSIMGRKKDVIIRGGQNISPEEVEHLVLKHPGVRDVAVVGMPDRVMGERTCAFVVPKAGQSLSFEELTAFLRQRKIAAYKLPERIEMVEQFPMSADGQKVQKRLLRDLVTRKLHQEGKL